MKIFKYLTEWVKRHCDPAGLRFLLLFATGASLVGLQFLVPATPLQPSPEKPSVAASYESSLEELPLRIMRPTGMIGIEEFDTILGADLETLETSKEIIICALGKGRFPRNNKVFSIENALVKPLVANGNGSFHHLTYYILRDFVEPQNASYSLILFDQHDDARSETPDLKHSGIPLGIDCGNWVRHAFESLPNLARVAYVRRNYMIPQGALWFSSILFEGRLDILTGFPISFFSAIKPESGWLSHTTRIRSDLFQPLFGNNRYHVEFPSFTEDEFLLLLQRMPTKKVYITVDLDVLRFEEFNDQVWGSGEMSVEQIIRSIEIIADHREIIGADVTGYPPMTYQSANYTPDKNRNSYIKIFKTLQKVMSAQEEAR